MQASMLSERREDQLTATRKQAAEEGAQPADRPHATTTNATEPASPKAKPKNAGRRPRPPKKGRPNGAGRQGTGKDEGEKGEGRAEPKGEASEGEETEGRNEERTTRQKGKKARRTDREGKAHGTQRGTTSKRRSTSGRDKKTSWSRPRHERAILCVLKAGTAGS